jgi:FeS assembly SUF system protein
MSNFPMHMFGRMPADGSEGQTPTEAARAGFPRDAASPPPSEAAIIEALREVHDPEIPVNIYDLGLIYDIDIGSLGATLITMTLTTPACPVAGAMPQRVADRVAEVVGVGEVEVRLVWDPPWDRGRMSEDARLALDMV